MAAAVLMPGMKPQKERHLQQPLVLSRSFLRSFPAMADVAVHSLPSLFKLGELQPDCLADQPVTGPRQST
eukprot:1151350-Pelagomonas_calceolata.AAC.1